MIASVDITGLGPHSHTEITLGDPWGPTTIAGHSMTGKSSILHALLMGLWGRGPDAREFPVELIGDGHERAAVQLTTSKGTVLRRTMTARRAWTRSVEKGGELITCPTEAAYQAQLGPLRDRAELGAFIVTPMAWRPMLESKLGRPLRDLLAGLLPDSDPRPIVAQMMADAGHDLRDSDPVDEAGAVVLQTAANRGAAEAEGRHQAAQRAAADAHAPVTAPSAEAVTISRAVADLDAAWSRHDQVAALHARDTAAAAKQTASRDAYRKRRAELGECPTFDAAATQAAELAVQNAERDRAAAIARREVVAREYREADAALKAHREATVCPTCGHSLEEPLDCRGLEARKAAAEVAGADARAAIEKADAALPELRRVFTEASRGREAAREWQAALRAMGTEPAVDAVGAAPQAPQQSRPERAAVDAAQRTLEAATAARGAQERADQATARATREAEAAAAALSKARAEAERVKALVACVRRAPSEIAAAQAAALGDMGPVALRFPPRTSSTTPEVEVLVDGRPWWTASDGRLVLADMHLRLAVRRLSRMPLPVVVDRAQDWSGEWPVVDDGPVWFLATAPCELTVSAGYPGEVSDAR